MFFHIHSSCDVIKRSDCKLVYGSVNKGDVVKSSDCILVYGSTTKGDVVKRSDYVTHMYNSVIPFDIFFFFISTIYIYIYYL